MPTGLSLSVRSGHVTVVTMPKIRTTRTKAPPEGYEEIEEVRIM